jgi:hypothetical protein
VVEKTIPALGSMEQGDHPAVHILQLLGIQCFQPGLIFRLLSSLLSALSSGWGNHSWSCQQWHMALGFYRDRGDKLLGNSTLKRTGPAGFGDLQRCWLKKHIWGALAELKWKLDCKTTSEKMKLGKPQPLTVVWMVASLRAKICLGM